jgi:hypothetical protein
MPKTKFQEYVFAIIMVLSMVYCMTLYNMALESGFNHASFINAFLGMWYEVIAAFLAQKFIAGPIVRKSVARMFKPGVDKPIFITLATAGLTVSMMAPMVTLFVTILHHGFTPDIVLLWLPKLVLNFPFALCLQVFYIGPFVRLVFRTLFKNQLALTNQLPQAAQEFNL